MSLEFKSIEEGIIMFKHYFVYLLRKHTRGMGEQKLKYKFNACCDEHNKIKKGI